jgi:hypothetical protein
VRAPFETKFNPWHDPEDGRFTFAGQGRYFSSGNSQSFDKNNRHTAGADSPNYRRRTTGRAPSNSSTQSGETPAAPSARASKTKPARIRSSNPKDAGKTRSAPARDRAAVQTANAFAAQGRSGRAKSGAKTVFIPYLSSLHNEILNAAPRYPAAPGTKEWSTALAVKWRLGLLNIDEFKAQWIRGYRNAIKAAAARFDLPPELIAGVAYLEVGGDVKAEDDVAFSLRSEEGRNLRGLRRLNRPRDLTSFGNVSLQVRRAAQALGYDSGHLTGSQQRSIIAALESPQTNIFIAAKHLSELRDLDFRGVSGDRLTQTQIEVIATRFNRGPDLSLEQILANLDYGQDVLKRWAVLEWLIR